MQPHQIQDEVELERALSTDGYLLFKHSLVCPTSGQAFREYRAFLEASPDTLSGWIDVIGQRSLSRRVAERTGVTHESPQALLLSPGGARWSASHGAITRASLAAALSS